MSKLRTLSLLMLTGAVVFFGVWRMRAGEPDTVKLRATLTKAYQDGNYKKAYEGLRKLALDPKNNPILVGSDLELTIQSINRLGRDEEVDELREAVVKLHEKNWRLLATAAKTLMQGDHNGVVVAGKFQRGMHQGGRTVNSSQRDRVRALQLMQHALELAGNEKDKAAVAELHLQFAELLLESSGYAGAWRQRHFLGSGYADAWRLQYLTDLSKLPDYEEGRWWQDNVNHNGAPIDADGKPVLHKIPKNYADAKSDGERWRWMLARAAELDANRLNETEILFADFMNSQLGVRTLAHYGWRFGNIDAQGGDPKTGTFALHALKDDETIARLAIGLKRFNIPDEYNWLKIWQRVAGRTRSVWGEQALISIAQDFEDRRQYPRAAEAWQRVLKEYGAGVNQAYKIRHEQIVGNWGRFENVQSQSAGKETVVDYRFRNGVKVAFEAHAVNVPKLLDDVRAYLESNPAKLDHQKHELSGIGYRLIEKEQSQYLLGKVASWSVDLKPRPKHVDDRISVKTPLKKAGAYLVTARMANGNLSRVLVWIDSTVIVEKTLESKRLYFVADATTGAPIANAKVDIFGFRQEQIAPNTNKFRVITKKGSSKTDNDGLVTFDEQVQPDDFQWLVTATHADADRFTFLGFTNRSYHGGYDAEYNASKAFVITDRPVYRPENTVKFKCWIAHAKYDQPNVSAFAGQAFVVRIQNPLSENVLTKEFTADEFGGIAGELVLPKTAKLGVYDLEITKKNGDHLDGHGSFRVEEYKKPEFEVVIEAPKEPVKLGDKVTATIEAKYYFGAPVTHATVKYKIMRQNHSSDWYAGDRWDWLYGNGYWWFAADYVWYPGFAEWGCMRPLSTWWYGDGEQPELVIENEVPIGPDGKIAINIDTQAAKELHGNQDHNFTITAEVTDASRRTIVGVGNILVARQPFKVYAWLDRGHYRTGDTIEAHFRAQTLDQMPVQVKAKRLEAAASLEQKLDPAESPVQFCEAPVRGKGELTLYRISYDKENNPVEKIVESWPLDTNVDGAASHKIKATKPGQYRLSYKVTDLKQNTIEGGYVFLVMGDGFDSASYRFNDLDLLTDKKNYQPGDTVKLAVNVNKAGGTVLLFTRPTNGVYLPPKVLRLKGKSVEEEIKVVQRDMPNFFIEAVTVADGRVHTETRAIVVPPEKRVVNVEVVPNQQEYKPGQKATVKVKLTDHQGKPFVGSAVVSVYDKSVEYISDGVNVPEIKEFFWNWRRHHSAHGNDSRHSWSANLLRDNEIDMLDIGLFGHNVVEEFPGQWKQASFYRFIWNGRDANVASGILASRLTGGGMAGMGGMGMAGMGGMGMGGMGIVGAGAPPDPTVIPGAAQQPAPIVRRKFADTALWTASLKPNKDGLAEVAFTTPDQLTAWKIRVWALGHGTAVGQGEAEIVTKKDLIVRLQAPRFFVQKDEVVMSANVHNFLKAEKKIRVSLEMDGGALSALDPLTRDITVASGSEARVDWRVKVVSEGEAVVRMKAVSDEDSDAMEMRFPCFVHGMLKMDSFTGVIRPDKDIGKVAFHVPAERRVNDSIFEVRYTPTLAGAMVDALPYLVDYPYGCTEQTLNRFLPTVITQRLLQQMKLDLKEIEKHRTNLNSGQIGDDRARIKAWQRSSNRNPVFDEAEVRRMSDAGVLALRNMQLSDGGWGWFSGVREQAWPHTTAVVVHGLQLAKQNGIALPPRMLEDGIEWLKTHQVQQARLLRNAPTATLPFKQYADNIDAMVYMTLVDSDVDNAEMRDFLYRDRTHLAVYAKAMFGLALHKQKQKDKLAMIMENIGQYLVSDDENQTAHLKLPESNPWWYWHGNEIEANAYYLKLLSMTGAKDEKASRLVKYLLNNRSHATYWSSTRDTAICVEAFADYLRASGEDRPDMTVEVWLDDKKYKDVRIDKSNLFSFDNKLILTGDHVTTGKHTLEIKRKGSGSVYFNAYVTYFTLEDFITKAGLEVKVNRKYYQLTRVEHKNKVSGSKGQPLEQAGEKYERTELANLATLKSGDLIEVELAIESKNDYEYLLFEDPKPAGFEPIAVQSGYLGNSMGAYAELRDEKVAFFVRYLARGKHSMTYQMRAETPGSFSALPTRAVAMYAPELKGNSDEIKVRVKDR